MKRIIIKDLLGTRLEGEDIIILKKVIEAFLDEGIEIDFEEVENVDYTLFSSLFDIQIHTKGKNYVRSQLVVKNLTNFADFNRKFYNKELTA